VPRKPRSPKDRGVPLRPEQEQRQAEEERRWRGGSIAILIAFLVIVGAIWAGIYLLTHW
jgi:hypothetical protein